MASAGAAEGDGEIIFSFGNVVRDEIGQQSFDLFQKNFCLREGADVAGDAGIFAAEAAELGNEVGIREEAYIEDQIGVGGNAVAEAEAHYRDDQRLEIGILELLGDDVLKFVNVEFGGVNDYVGETADGSHLAALFADAFADRQVAAMGCGRRVSLKRRMRTSSLASTKTRVTFVSLLSLR